jgi:hypothetical protein
MAKLTAKSTKEAWILALLADTNQFPKKRAVLKPLSAALGGGCSDDFGHQH